MGTVSVNFPKTPVTAGSNAKSIAPGSYKFPAPTAPFMVVVLPNISDSGKSPQDYTTTVQFDGEFICTTKSNCGSMGDVASPLKGLLSSMTEGICVRMVGSPTVKVDGNPVSLLSDMSTNDDMPKPGQKGNGAAKDISADPTEFEDEEEKKQTVQLLFVGQDGEPVQNAEFELFVSGESFKKGKLDASGKAKIEDVPSGALEVRLGPDSREWTAVDREKNKDFIAEEPSEKDLDKVLEKAGL